MFQIFKFSPLFPVKKREWFKRRGKSIDAQKAVIKTSARRFKHLPSFVCCNNKKNFWKRKMDVCNLFPFGIMCFLPTHMFIQFFLTFFLNDFRGKLNFYNVYLKRFLMKNSRFVLKKEKNQFRSIKMTNDPIH